MKMVRKLELGERIAKDDLCKVGVIGRIITEEIAGIYFRPIPEPTWRKISDGPVTYPCWVTDGKDVIIATYGYGDGLPCSISKRSQWDKKITHWMPKEAEQKPPAPEKTAEEIAFDEWFNRTHYLGNAVREAFHAAWTAAKGQR